MSPLYCTRKFEAAATSYIVQLIVRSADAGPIRRLQQLPSRSSPISISDG